MMYYSVQSRNQIIAKNYGFLSFAKNMSKNIGKNISKSLSGKYSQNLLSGKYSQNLLDHAKQSTSETITNEHDKELPNERYTSPEERQGIIDELRLI